MALEREDGDTAPDPDDDGGVGRPAGAPAACGREMALLALMEKTGYSMEQENGQRKYGGPPPGWDGPPPPRGCEVFVGKIPRDMYEDALVPLFERAGRIYELRLMMEFSGENRGYAFVTYTCREAARSAIALLDNHEVRPGKFIGVCVSLDNCRLFIGSIPRDKSRDDVLQEMSKVTKGVVDVIMYPSSTDKNRNRGFAFVEFESHKAAAMARRRLIPGTFQLWGQSVQVDWAEPEKDVDEEVMRRVRVLYVRNLTAGTSEETLTQEFSRFKPGCVERVRKLSDYAFVHYRCRADALTALSLMDGARLDGAALEVTLAKPAGTKGGGARRPSGRGYSGGGGAAGGDAAFHPGECCSSGRPPPLLAHLGNPVYSGAGEPRGRRPVPLLPGTPLLPTSPLALQQSQLGSAVSLLDLLCCRNRWTPPDYFLFSTPGPDGQLLLLYKVVIPSTRSVFMPDQLCHLLDDAKELAAQTTLWSLDSSLMNGQSCDVPSGPLSPPPSSAVLAPGVLTCGGGGRPFASCPTPPPPPPPPPPPAPPAPPTPSSFSLSPLSSLSSLSTPSVPQTQSLFISSPPPYY